MDTLETMDMPGHTPALVPLPGRRESLLLLDERLTTLRAKTRTDVHGIAKVWQPSDMLPDFTKQKRAFAEIRRIQLQARTLPPEVLFVLIGDTVTEDGLPLFTSRLFSAYGLPTGNDSDVYSHQGNLQKWFRRWTGEEHRHGQLLNNYLRLTGRVDMRAYEQSVQLFLDDGMDLQMGNDPYAGFVYTSFQELATQRSHSNVAKLANKHGNPLLAKMCKQIALDEARHAKAYIDFVSIFFERDPNEMMKALSAAFERGIVMPAHNMREIDPSGNLLQPGETYERFSNVAQRIGVYTAKDYAEISGQLLKKWRVAEKKDAQWRALSFNGLNDDGLDAQRRIVRRQKLVEKIATRDRPKEAPSHETSWIVRNERQ